MTWTVTELSPMTFDPTKGLNLIALYRLTLYLYDSDAPTSVELRLLGVFLFGGDHGISL